jgi:hypothetical protein
MYVSFMPEQKIGLVVLSNQDKWGGDLAYALEELVYAIALNKSKEEIDGVIEKHQSYAQGAAEKFYKNKSLKAPLKTKDLDKQFVGNFVHDTLGNINIIQKEDGTFQLHWGNLRSDLLNGDKPNELKVEFVPSNVEEIVFVQASDKQSYLKYRDYWFTQAQ